MMEVHEEEEVWMDVQVECCVLRCIMHHPFNDDVFSPTGQGRIFTVREKD